MRQYCRTGTYCARMFVFFIKWLLMLWRNESDAPKLALRGPPMMTSDAKRALAKTIRELRERSSCPICARRPSARISSRSTPRRRRFPRPRAPNARIEAWLDEQTRAVAAKARPEANQRLFGELIKDAGATLLQRLVYLHLLETNGLRTVPIVTGG